MEGVGVTDAFTLGGVRTPKGRYSGALGQSFESARSPCNKGVSRSVSIERPNYCPFIVQSTAQDQTH
jgi:hypothetical protein